MRWLLAVLIVLLEVAPAAAQPGADDPQVYTALPPLALPPVEPGTLAFGSALELVSGAFELTGSGVADNGVDDEITIWSLALGTRYYRSLEMTSFGYSIELFGEDTLMRTPFDGGSRYDNSLNVNAVPEARLYPAADSQFFLHATGLFDVTASSVAFYGTDADLESDTIAPGNVGLVAGVGFGRVLAIDPVVRLRRLEMALAEEGALDSPISTHVGTAIIRDWYALRNDIGNYRQLAYALKELDAAGALRGPPDIRTTFKAIQVLDDPFIVNRRRGGEARAGLGVVQPFVGYDGNDEPDANLAALASGQYEEPLSTTRQVSLIGKALVNLGGTDDTDPPRPWSLRGFATLTQVYYTPLYIPTGAMTLTAEAGVSGVRQNELFPEVETGIDGAAEATYTRVLNRGSLAAGSVRVSARNDGVFAVTISLGITWGVASGFFTPYAGAGALH